MSRPKNSGTPSSRAENERRSKTAFELAPVGLAIVAADGQWLEVNPRLCEIIGYTAEELRELTCRDITYAPDVDGDLGLMQLLLAGKLQHYSLEKRYVCKDGKPVWINLNVALAREADGAPDRFIHVVQDINLRKKAERKLGLMDDELKNERSFVNAVLDNAGALVVVLDREGRIRRFNRACEELSLYTFAEVEGKFPWDVLLATAERDTVHAEAFRAHVENPEQLHGSYTSYWVTKSREMRLIEWSNVLLLGAQGQMEFMVCSGIDVTEKRAVEAALKRSKETYARAEAIAHIGSWDWDIVTGGLHWTDEIYRIFGLAPQPFGATYNAFLDSIHADDRQQVIDAVNASVADANVPYSIEHRVVRPRGEVRVVEERGLVYRDADGKPVRMIGTVHDITEQKRTDEELRRHQEHLEELVQERTAELQQAQRIGRMGNWTLNLASGELAWSDEIFRIFGHQPGAFSPTFERFMSTVHPADVACIEQAIQEACADGRQHSIDHRILLPDGEVRWVNESGVAAFDASGNPISLSGTIHDITERKQVEQAMLEAKEAAERANRAKSEFLSRMSHELRTPMNAILGFSQLLRIEALTPDQQGFVDEIYQAGEHLLELINELLDLARIEAGKLPTAIKATPLRPLVEQAAQLIQPLLHKMEVTLLYQCEHDFTVLADPTRLKQVLVKLLSNAAKYNRHGGSIRIGSQLLDGERMRLSIVDSGAGIAPENFRLLFQPFERLGVSELTAIEGAGIGLAISKRLIDLMGGAIGVESAPGQGSTFWIELPLAQRLELAAAAPAALPPEAIGKFSVLYVEDNAANLRVVEAMLRHQPDLTLLSASNGEYGLELAQRYLPQVILLDIHLLGMDGYAVLRELQGRPETRNIPVIALSADAMPIDVERGLAAGFERYLTKPVKIQELVQAIEQAMAVPASSSLSDLK